MKNIKKPVKAHSPKQSHLYRKYDEITLDHCKLLLVHLYEGKMGEWDNPITGNTINNSSYITISFLSKCYYLWGNKIATINSKKLKYKKHIEKFIAKEYLFDIPAIKPPAVPTQKLQGALVNVMNKRRSIRSIRRGGTKNPLLMVLFNKCCKNLEDNCIVGQLENHIHISYVVNSILHIIYDIYTTLLLNIPLYIYMYDDGIIYDDFKGKYEANEIKYQKDDLMKYVNNAMIDLEPKDIETYKKNTLYNRQYVFEISKDGETITIKYNQINTYNEKGLSLTPFNYNITNSVLPKKISIDGLDSLDDVILSEFNTTIEEINERLRTLPTIVGIKTELTDKYDNIIKQMGTSEFGFCNNVTIRKNILYSLNAQYPKYYEEYSRYKDEIYYNYEYTGSFPIFTWIPITTSSEVGDATTDIYNFPSSSKWQPFDLDDTKIKEVELAYKNNYESPFSKSLNETIYKVILGESTNVDETMKERIEKTLGIYKEDPIKDKYKNNKIYLYHGAKNNLYMKHDSYNIEILGFLSTTLNMYTASFYSGYPGGFIYIIEVDDTLFDTHTYINLNDDLKQFLLLPHSIISIVHTFDYMGKIIILCKLIKTPNKRQNNALYKKLLPEPAIMEGKGGKLEGRTSAKNAFVNNYLNSLLQTTNKLIKNKEGISLEEEHHRLIEDTNKKINDFISEYKSIYKYEDLPEDFQRYYGEQNKGTEIDIYNGCHFRLIPKELEKSQMPPSGGSIKKKVGKKVKSLKKPILSNSVKKVRKGK